MSRKKVSVCIPSYNSYREVKRLLDSLIIQSFQDYDIIISDDSTNDEIEMLVNGYDLKNLTYNHNKAPKGSPENWNAAIEMATGEYVKIMHHDDWFSRTDSLALFVEAMDKNPHVDFCFSNCNAILNDLTGEHYTHIVNSEFMKKLEHNPYEIFPINHIGAPSVTMFRRSAFCRFDKNVKYVVDILFYITILKKNRFFSHIPECLINITSRGNNQVTKQCMTQEIQLYEWFYLYSVVRDEFELNTFQKSFLKGLLKQYNVTDKSFFKKRNLKLPCFTYPVILCNKITELFSFRKKKCLI